MGPLLTLSHMGFAPARNITLRARGELSVIAWHADWVNVLSESDPGGQLDEGNVITLGSCPHCIRKKKL